MTIITLPGIGGSGVDHWQSHWERESTGFQRFSPASWDEPDFEDWFAAVGRSVPTEPTILVAHSLACLVAVRWSAAHPGRLAGMFLVAAPDPAGPIFPQQAASFGADLQARPSVPTLLVTSDDDPYCSELQSVALAREWRVPRVSIGRQGHVNSASGLGAWGEGRSLLTAFAAGLGIDC
ncbi:MAG: RBBP9/YdeN family alpha/beta hydrolase [Rhodoglobus sp.]